MLYGKVISEQLHPPSLDHVGGNIVAFEKFSEAGAVS